MGTHIYKTKKELAMAYSPGVSYAVARQRLLRWMKGCPPLMRRLEMMGYHSQNRTLKTPEIKIIFKYLGKPSSTVGYKG